MACFFLTNCSENQKNINVIILISNTCLGPEQGRDQFIYSYQNQWSQNGLLCSNADNKFSPIRENCFLNVQTTHAWI